MIKFQNKIHVYSVRVCVMSMCLREGRKGKWVKDKGIEEKCTTLVNLENQCMVALYNYFGNFYVLIHIEIKEMATWSTVVVVHIIRNKFLNIFWK